MRLFALIMALTVCSVAMAHDTWVQTNTNIVRAGDLVHVDLLLGNHGNTHRDHKIAGKLDLNGSTIEIIDPSGKVFDLKSQLNDMGYSPQEGFWTTRFEPVALGLYTVAHRSDRVMSYAPERSIKSGKTYFIASESLDKVQSANPGFDRPLGHELELVPLLNPVTPMGPGSLIKVQLLYKGKPLKGERVSFIPRGANLKPGLDERYERLTNDRGEAEFEPNEANSYLIAAHKTEPEEKGTLAGKSYQFTKYGATLTVYVPRICSCCGG
jgi:uncharacterized GH25 family protein